MGLLRQRSRLVATSPAWRGALWRWRHAFLAIALLTGFLLLADVLLPAPSGRPVVTLRHDVPADRDLTTADLLLSAGDDGAPESSFADAADVAGRRLVVALPAGTVVTTELLVGPGLAQGAPEGHVVMPVAIADSGSRALADIGTRVTLLGSQEFGLSGTLASDVLILSILEEPETTGLISTGATATTLIVAVPRSLANVVVDASALGPLRVAVPTAFP